MYYFKINLFLSIFESNLFLTKNNVIKIGDLGIAKIMDKELLTHTQVGTEVYKSPEQKFCYKGYSTKADVW